MDDKVVAVFVKQFNLAVLYFQNHYLIVDVMVRLFIVVYVVIHLRLSIYLNLHL